MGQNCGAVDNQEGYTDCPATLNFGAYDKKQCAALHDELHLELCSGSRPTIWLSRLGTRAIADGMR